MQSLRGPPEIRFLQKWSSSALPFAVFFHFCLFILPSRFSTMAQEAVGSGESSSDVDAALPKRAEDYIQTASQCYGASVL